MHAAYFSDLSISSAITIMVHYTFFFIEKSIQIDIMQLRKKYAHMYI